MAAPALPLCHCGIPQTIDTAAKICNTFTVQ
jgi:hypothetical protein